MSENKNIASNSQYQDLYKSESDVIISTLINAQQNVFQAINSSISALTNAVDAMSLHLKNYPKGRIGFTGAGTSGRLAVGEMAELPPTFGWPKQRLLSLIAGGDAATQMEKSRAEDDIDLAITLAQSHNISEQDCIIGVAASGTTPFTCKFIEEARAKGALTIAITNATQSPLADLAQYPIIAQTGPEVLAGSTRLAAGTAQKIILNSLTTAVMMKLGLVYKGRMIAMVPTNQKLVKRAINMICELCNIDNIKAESYLKRADNHLPTALMIAHGADISTAQQLLQHHQDNFVAALEAWQNKSIAK